MRTGPSTAIQLAVFLTIVLTTLMSAQESRTGAPATVAVLYFTNAALVDHSGYEPLSKGIAEMLITELSTSNKLRVVERARLQQLLEEQDLVGEKRVDEKTAIRLGKILSARHLLTGVFVIVKDTMRLDVRSVNVETSVVEYTTTVSGKADAVLELIAELGRKVNDGLHYPPLPSTTGITGATSKSEQLRAVMLLSRALNEEDRGNLDGAVALYKQALEVHPEYGRAQVLLASAEARRGS